MAALAPPYLDDQIPAPAVPYGLFNVSVGPKPFPVEAAQAGGVLYVPDDCQDDVFLRMIQCPPITGTISFSGIETPISGAPFAVYSTWTCSTVGYTLDEQVQRLRTRHALRVQTAVERRLWQGQTSATDGNITGLFSGATVLGAAACVTEAIEMLEQGLADNGVFGGIIHARPGMSAHLSQAHQVNDRGRRKETFYGTPYVFGQGYSGVGPTGQTPDGTTEWMYATGRVVVWQDPTIQIPSPPETINRSLNTVNLVAEQVHAVAVECGVWAVSVTRNCATTGAT